MAKSTANTKFPLVLLRRALHLKQPLLLSPYRLLCFSSPSFWMAVGDFGHDTMEA